MLSGGEKGESRSEPNEGEPTTPRVLTVLSFVMERLVARNDGLVVQRSGLNEQPPQQVVEGLRSPGGKGLDVFHGVRAPSISIPKYLERIYKYTNCSPSCFVVGYVYIDRLVHKHPNSPVVSLNVHRLLVTSVMVASKMLDDVHYDNAFYARVGGVSNAELNRLELELLFLLDFSLMVSSRVFESYCLHLEKEMMWFGVGQKIERAVMFASVDDETEISIEDTLQSSSPPQQVE
ncbi:cyclin-U1-1 [Telopea speciosissima]|uniref:cyclin-U1-1 n=1 Tax=Telopea speciosissima TaxID=54955 RepID=UPI001CC6CDA1|nr:cyclin-U1-1 [Telopea speciosissima]